MRNLESALKENSRVSDYKINIHEKKSYEMFFVKGRLETVRRTSTRDTEVTVYVAHGEFLGNADFPVYPSTTPEALSKLIDEAVEKALLICNKPYSLPENDCGEFTVESNFSDFRPEELAAVISNTVFSANQLPNGSLNAVEVFVNRHYETVVNSRGIHKSQVRYDAMVEAIPTYNGETQSVELYEQYNFSSLDEKALYQEIAGMMDAVKARYEAKRPEQKISCKVVLNKQELSQLFFRLANNLRYSNIYTHMSVYKKGDQIQKEAAGDSIELTMAGAVEGSMRSSKFDSDGVTLGEMNIVRNGTAVNYYGSSRFGQYLGETPTGVLPCMKVAPGTLTNEEIRQSPYLEVISMSGLQVDFFSDYIGGEIRLAYYFDGEKITPLTGISMSGSLREALNTIRLSGSTAIHGAYCGPEKAMLANMKIY